MAKRSKIENQDKVISFFEFESKTKDASGVVGYDFDGSLGYAIYQHENLEYNHPNGGQAKFLEQPTRTKGREMANIVAKYMTKGKRSLAYGVRMALEFLKEESQALCPVDTGALRASAYVAMVED